MAVKKHAIAVCGDTGLIDQDHKLVKAYEDEAGGTASGKQNRKQKCSDTERAARISLLS